jgi:hypothetical protein
LFKDEDLNNNLSATSQKDVYQQFGEWRSVFYGGAAKNSLAGYGNGATIGGRGGFSKLRIITNPVGDGTPKTATAVLDVCEPIPLSPFLLNLDKNESEKMLYGVNNFSINLSLGNLSRVWCHDIDSNVTNWAINVSIDQSASPSISYPPTLLMNFTTPNPLDGPMISANSWPYLEYQILPVNVGVLAPGSAAVTANMNSVNLKAVPNMMLVYARENTGQQQAADGYKFSDTFAVIESISVQFNNKSGILASATQEDLYNISCSNGLNMNFSDFSRFSGSVLCLKFSKDIPLSNNLAVGQAGSFNLQLSVNVSRPAMLPGVSPAVTEISKNYTLYCVVVYEGVLNLNNGTFSHSVAPLSGMDVLNAPDAKDEDAYEKNEAIYGGSWWSNLKSGISRGLDYVRPVVNAVGGPYKQLYDAGRDVTGLGLHIGGAPGNGGALLNGGEMMTKESIMKRVKKLKRQL